MSPRREWVASCEGDVHRLLYINYGVADELATRAAAFGLFILLMLALKFRAAMIEANAKLEAS